jgi:thioredoxin-related protein
MVKIIYLIFVLGLLLTVASANDGFILSSIDEGRKLSNLTNKPLLVIFGSDNCPFCVSLKQDILDLKLSPDIDKYIICYIDLKEYPELKNQYDISMIPDSRIIINDQQKSKLKGYAKQNYIKWLNNAR